MRIWKLSKMSFLEINDNYDYSSHQFAMTTFQKNFLFVFIAIFILVIKEGTISAKILKPDFVSERWKVLEITLQSDYEYLNPFNDVDVTAVFVGPNNEIINRPAFWDGNNCWKIRFAPTVEGKWRMRTISNQNKDKGIHDIKSTIICKPYSGNLDIYRHGFVKVSGNARYFIYNDSTPFFYLGDTHWLFVHERFARSNIDTIPSQFCYLVDKRVNQGFTVYQSEAIQRPHSDKHSHDSEEAYCHLENGFGNDDLAGFRNMDRKFEYIAEKGLLHANSQVCWVEEPVSYPDVYTIKYMYRLGRYWSARYGAYPVLWTIAQEVDKDFFGRINKNNGLQKWQALARGLTENDDYHHPLSAHMERISSTSLSNSSWKDLLFHNWWAVQWNCNMSQYKLIEELWNYTTKKPLVLFEAGYENLSKDSYTVIGDAYMAFLSGMFGYGYGANGVWNDLYDMEDWGTAYKMPEHYTNWFWGSQLNGAILLKHFKQFFTSFEWWKLEPQFSSIEFAKLDDKTRSAVSVIGDQMYVCYLGSANRYTGKLYKLDPRKQYMAIWFDPSNGIRCKFCVEIHVYVYIVEYIPFIIY